MQPAKSQEDLYYLSIFFLCLTNALRLPSLADDGALAAMDVPSISNRQQNSTSALEPSSIFVDGGTQTTPVCDIDRYGPLKKDSCNEAVYKLVSLGSGGRSVTWADRDYPNPRHQLPARFSSCTVSYIILNFSHHH